MENVLSELNPQQLFNQLLSERLKANTQQIKTWSDYKKRHEKVIEGLDVLPQDLSINCMVPIGKRALMPGKLNRTNEITVCLGDGYFAKYTAAQAKALCNRRIKKADEMLENLEKERSLYETRSMLPNYFDIFNNEDKKDFNEHWDDKKLEDWRQSYSSDYSEEATNEIQEKKSSKANYRLQVLNNVNTGQLSINTENKEKEENYNVDQSAGGKKVTNNEETSSTSKDNLLQSKTVDCKKDKDEARVKEKKVAFAEPQVKYFSNEEEMEVATDKRRISVIEQKLYEYSKEDDDSEDESDEDDTIRIYFKHSEGAPSIPVSEGEQIVTPRDIYKTIPGPKSILKKTPDFNKSDGDNVSIIDKQSHLPSLADESEEELKHGSVYSSVVKEIKEHVPEKKVQSKELTDKPAEQPRQARQVSRFKLERAALRK
ncbi:hypothetical protein G9C98_007243 [Cotesia typhae]|uniref:Uncharacterized protein n=1 Tax=Cotesia typhae TaxID=2053667 RepID=A0A8J5RAG6_9HYME|nr:hypothetical protein G9C98_007243 [Cotesia typhae]